MRTGQGAGVTTTVGCMAVGQLFDAWDDLDRALAGLGPAELLEPWEGGSAFAWTYGHAANSIDAWINVRFAGNAPHPIVGAADFRIGGSGRAEDWPAIERGVREVRARARAYLHELADADLDLVIPYDGSYAPARRHGLSLRLAILIGTAHHYYHIGEIATKRERLGRPAGDSPASRRRCWRCWGGDDARRHPADGVRPGRHADPLGHLQRGDRARHLGRRVPPGCPTEGAGIYCDPHGSLARGITSILSKIAGKSSLILAPRRRILVTRGQFLPVEYGICAWIRSRSSWSARRSSRRS